MTDAAQQPNPRSSASRSTKKEMVARERRILNALVAGVNAAEIARREGLSLRRMQQLTKAIFARRRDAMPEHFVDLQVTRLQEALIVSYAAMGGGNMQAVDRFVRIVRELDRYAGFSEAGEVRLGGGRGEEEGAKQIASQVAEKIESGETSRPLALVAPATAPLDLAATPADPMLPENRQPAGEFATE